MKSFAFYYKPYEGKEATENIDVSELHVNIWKVDIGKYWPDYKIYIDFGMKLSQDIEFVRVYIPFEIEENGKDFDLVNTLNNNNQLLCTVFNSDFRSMSSQTASFAPVHDESKNGQPVEFYLHQLGATKFTLEPFKVAANKKDKTIGQILKIHIQRDSNNDSEDLEPNKPVYIRFRIQPKKIRDFIQSEHISNDFLQAAFSRIDLFDVRINERRNLNLEVKDALSDDSYKIFKFDKIHLYFMAESKEKIENGSSIKIDSRLLECDLWKNYLPKGCHRCNYIAHHWKKRIEDDKNTVKVDLDVNKLDEEGKSVPASVEIKKEVSYKAFDDYHIFFTSVYPNLSLIRIVIYLCVAVLLSWCGSMLSFSISQQIGISIPLVWKTRVVGAMLISIVLYAICTSYRLILKIIRK